MIEHAPLQSVYIYFDTATYDEIERDVKAIITIKTILLIAATNDSLIERVNLYESNFW